MEKFNPQCGRGWQNRCATAKNKICRCKCRGLNHGNPAARNRQSEVSKERFAVPIEMFRPDLIGKVVGIRIDGRPVVYYDGHWLDPAPSIAMRNHSPDGFEWGYAGSGCAQLALAICLKYLSPAESEIYYQQFKFETIAPLPKMGFQIKIDDIKFMLNKLAS